MKTPEEMAEEYCREWWGNYLVADYLKSAVKAGFLGGYQAGVKEAEERILNEFFDNYGADEHASFALRVNAYQWNKNDK